MKGHKNIITALNQCLCKELTAINQFFLHSKMLKDWGYGVLAKHAYDESIEEMEHADKLMERILFLEGTPDMSAYDKLMVGNNVKDQFKYDLKLELANCDVLQKAIETCFKVGDHATRELFETLLAEEQEHVDWLETQMRLMNELGTENYLAQQLGERE